MTIGVGGKTKAEALAALSDMTAGVQPITKQEYDSKFDKDKHNFSNWYFEILLENLAGRFV